MKSKLIYAAIVIFVQSMVQSALAQPYFSEITDPERLHIFAEIVSTEEVTLEPNRKNIVSEVQFRVYPSAYDRNSTLLLHLKAPVFNAQLFITDMFGNTIDIPLEAELKSGFYEFSILQNYSMRGVFMACLVVNGKVYSQPIIRY